MHRRTNAKREWWVSDAFPLIGLIIIANGRATGNLVALWVSVGAHDHEHAQALTSFAVVAEKETPVVLFNVMC